MKLNEILQEFITYKEAYYIHKLNIAPLNKVISDSIKKDEVLILRKVIDKYFPQYTQTLLKYLIIA